MLFKFNYIIAILLLSGCSFFGRRNMVDSNLESAAVSASNASAGTVSKAQYDELLKKYEALLKERRDHNIVKEETEVKGPAELVEELNKADVKADLVETVDVFGKDGLPHLPVGVKEKTGELTIEDEIKELREADRYLVQNQLEQAMTIVRPLEKSSTDQIRVRAKNLIGDILLRQGEYDLAMQVFEDIVQKEAFSGVVIKVLGKLIVCTEKLKLSKKRDQYYSMLHDFFETTL